MSLGHGSSIVRSGLVLHLDAANRKSYPGSGTSWIDLSQNNHNATLVNGITWDTTANGQFALDGSNDYFSVNDGNYFNTNEFTVECWMYFEEIATTFTGYSIVMKNTYNTSGWQFALGTGGSLNNRQCGIRFSVTSNVASVAAIVPSLSSLPFNSWHQIVMTLSYNGSASTWTLYIDGNYSGATSPFDGTFVSNNIPLYIGAPGPGNGSYLKGKISNYKIYNRALSAAEIQQNFEALRGRYGI